MSTQTHPLTRPRRIAKKRAGCFVVKEGSPDSYRDRINICAEKPAHRKSAKR